MHCSEREKRKEKKEPSTTVHPLHPDRTSMPDRVFLTQRVHHSPHLTSWAVCDLKPLPYDTEGVSQRISSNTSTPSLPRPVTFLGWKVHTHTHTHTPANSIFDGPITNLLSVPCIVAEILSHVQVKGMESLNAFKVCTFIGHFPSDDAASTAVKGFKWVIPLREKVESCMFR